MAAIQIAKLLGARVIATAGSEAKLERARELGADDGHRPPPAGRGGRGAAPHRARRAWRSWSSTWARPPGSGRSCPWPSAAGSSPAAPPPARRARPTCATCSRSSSRCWARTWAARPSCWTRRALFFAGRLRPVVHAVLPLAEARRAHEMMEASQHFGKIVLQRRDERPPGPRRRGPSPLPGGRAAATARRSSASGTAAACAGGCPPRTSIVDAGDGVRLLAARQLAAGRPRAQRPALLLVHGLGGWDHAALRPGHRRLAYAGLARRAHEHARRGRLRPLCARPLQRGPGRRPRGRPRPRWPRTRPRVAVVGFSLGANLTLLALGRSGAPARRPAGGGRRLAAARPRRLRRPRWSRRPTGSTRRYFMRNLAERLPRSASACGPTSTRRAASAAAHDPRVGRGDHRALRRYAGRGVLRAVQRRPARPSIRGRR